MRCFVAIAIPESTRVRLVETLVTLRRRRHDARWVAPENLHVSLAFLGEVPDNELNGISGILTNVANGVRSFTLKICGAGTFGPPRHPRVLWAGIPASTELTALHAALSTQLSERGFRTDDREYSPHVTLARFSRPGNCRPVTEWLEQCGQTEFGPVDAREILLMESVLEPQGARYRPVKFFRLADSGTRKV